MERIIDEALRSFTIQSHFRGSEFRTPLSRISGMLVKVGKNSPESLRESRQHYLELSVVSWKFFLRSSPSFLAAGTKYASSAFGLLMLTGIQVPYCAIFTEYRNESTVTLALAGALKGGSGAPTRQAGGSSFNISQSSTEEHRVTQRMLFLCGSLSFLGVSLCNGFEPCPAGSRCLGFNISQRDTENHLFSRCHSLFFLSVPLCNR